MLRRILSGIAWTAGGLVALCVVLYLVILAINWRDREPSATALRFEQLYENRPAVPDDRNAYVYVMGFEADVAQNPLEMGQKRIAWMRQAMQERRWQRSKDPLRDAPELRAGRDPITKQLIDACSPGNAACRAAFDDGGPVLDAWMKSEKWLLDRYRTLLAYPGWYESVPYDPQAPLLSFSHVIDGQRLLLLNAHASARKGDHAIVKALLQQDVRFWRMLLESSDILITKMIATGALNRHFELGNVVLSGFARDPASAIPDEWHVELTDAERSMRRTLVGEWVFSSQLVGSDFNLWYRGWVPDYEESFGEKVERSLTAPLYKRQDFINGMAEKHARKAELLSAPIRGYEAALKKAADVAESNSMFSLYNPVGRLLLAMDWDVGSYAARVSDIEGVRRAALLAVTLRAQGVNAAGVPAALPKAALRNPYDGRPFEWDAERGAIVFQGLERSERGRHFISY